MSRVILLWSGGKDAMLALCHARDAGHQVVALATFFLYYSLLSFGLSMAESGAVPPGIALWLPNVLFFLAGLYGLHLANQERTLHIVALIQYLRKPRLVQP